MTTIDDIRARLRLDLDDSDPASERWSNSELDRHIAHALRLLSEALPRQRKSTLTTVAGSRDLDISTLVPRIEVVAVEYPSGQYPPQYVPFSIWINTLTLLIASAPAGGQNVNLYWTAPHYLDASGTSLDQQEEEILLDGAAGYAAQQWAAFATNRVNVGGPKVVEHYSALARTKLEAFHNALLSRGRRASLRPSRLYTPAEPKPSQSTDFGP